MLPAKQNKINLANLTEEELKLFRLYGKLPTNKDVMGQRLKERKYFDSGDYALSKAGKTSSGSVGTAIPSPENIPHATHPTSQQNMNNGNGISSGSPPNTSHHPAPVYTSGMPGRQPHSTSPIKESSLSSEVTYQIVTPPREGVNVQQQS